MTDQQRQRIAEALRTARGHMTKQEAQRRSGISRQWWLEAERGDPVRLDYLARAIAAVGGDPGAVFAEVGLDLNDFAAPDDEPLPMRPVLADVLDRLHGLERKVDRLAVAVERIAPVDPPGSTPGDQAPPRATGAP